MLNSIGTEPSVVKKNCPNRKLSTAYHRELSTEHHLARTVCNRELSTDCTTIGRDCMQQRAKLSATAIQHCLS